MIVANHVVLEDRLMHCEPRLAVMIVEVHGHGRLMTRLAFRIFSEAARSFREGIGEHEPLRLDDLPIHTLLPLLDSVRQPHAESPTPAATPTRSANVQPPSLPSPP